MSKNATARTRKTPYRRSITPQAIKALRNEVPEHIDCDTPMITEQEAEEFRNRIPASRTTPAPASHTTPAKR